VKIYSYSNKFYRIFIIINFIIDYSNFWLFWCYCM